MGQVFPHRSTAACDLVPRPVPSPPLVSMSQSDGAAGPLDVSFCQDRSYGTEVDLRIAM